MGPLTDPERCIQFRSHARSRSDTSPGQRPSDCLKLRAACHCSLSSVIRPAHEGQLRSAIFARSTSKRGKAAMSTGPDPKNPASSAGSGNAAASSAAPWQPFGAAWGTSPWGPSLDTMSAWADTWQSMLQKRGGPAAEAMQKALFNPAAWSEGVAPLMDELQDVFALPHFADLPRLDASSLPSPGPMVEL